MKEQALPPVALRYAAYSVVLLAWLVSLPLILRVGGREAFAEGRFVEWFQFGIVALAAAVLLVGGWRLSGWRELLVLLAALAGMAAIREQDNLLESLWIGWKFPAVVCAAGGIAVAVRDLPALGRQVRRFVGTAGFGMLWAGLLTVVCAAQLIGHGDMLQMVMGDDYDRGVKRVVEESFESFGYLVVLAGSIETLVYARREAAAARPVLSEAMV